MGDQNKRVFRAKTADRELLTSAFVPPIDLIVKSVADPIGFFSCPWYPNTPAPVAIIAATARTITPFFMALMPMLLRVPSTSAATAAETAPAAVWRPATS